MDPNGHKIHSLLYRSEGMKKAYGYEPDPSHAVPIICIPLYTYLLALGVTTVDYFSLDVEGSDFEVLKTIPFDKVKFLVWPELPYHHIFFREILTIHTNYMSSWYLVVLAYKQVLGVEVQWVTEGREAVKKFMESKGYVFMKEIKADYMFVHSSLLKNQKWDPLIKVVLPSCSCLNTTMHCVVLFFQASRIYLTVCSCGWRK